MKKILPLLLVLFAFASVSFAQQSPKPKYYIYTFTVTGVKTQSDVNKLDNFLKNRKGVVSSQTDLQKKTVEVKVENYLTYDGIIAAVKSQGFEASEKHTTKSSDQ
jgi:copper chaperone CopZ